ncbi:hypothetical protein M378DRAFT_170333 [Amanita muscaria Koide BX008]|uniref:NACHT domain-containing protein n=1 Tax=Amanita muscaria (strain Koide BX008) TaxID=946122 RepID=A0A0C2S7D5_AMAMK|nr:hypothetical protein M378DRAFT_170333 [Amanita muscaria Koide BX008]
MNHGNGDARQIGGGSNLDFPISTNARRNAKEPRSGDGVVQREEAMSTAQRASNASNQIPPTQNLGVTTGDGARFQTAHFTGGGHAFGSNSIVNNNTFKIIRSGDGQFTESQRNLICDFIANHANLPDINHHLNRKFLTQSIINLPRAEAVFDDYQTKKKSGPCFEGTRVALLREMADWATGSDESRMYILSGLAGIGKSTVAYTIASRAADLNLLGASFFFSRDEGNRKNAKKFFTTIAYQLCLYNKAFAEAIGNMLQTDGGSAITKGPREQLKALIVDPLRGIVQSRTRPILVVVDALDECDEDDWFSVLTGLRQLVQELPSFKVILTTRPQSNLDRFFRSQDGHKIFRLQDIENKVVDGDIRLYLKHSLSLAQVQERLPMRKWCASDDEIDCLVRAAGRLFIIASTSVRYILDKVASNPAAQMQKLLFTFVQDRMPFKDLDEFYTVILRSVAPVDCDDDIVDRYKSVVGAIISVQHPLPVTTLAHLIDIDVEEIRAVIINLQSVILLGDDDIPRIYHKSLSDYITDSKRCKDGNLHIDPMIRHMRITIHCFRIMEQRLKYNILDIGTPARFMSNEDGLAKDGITKEQLERDIPPPLQYACVSWANHLEAANVEDANVMKALEQFADKHLLHWFEALSLIRKLDCAHRAIRIVLKVLKSASSDLHQLLLDGLRFISKFYGTIETSALHTYYSALSFTPTDTLLYHRYINEAAHNVCSVEGGPAKWDALVASWSHGEEVDAVKFSLDNTMLVSLSETMLKVWDAVTGTPISMISGDGFAIANDFSTVASLKDNIITLYDVNGNERGAGFTTRANIVKVAISSESNRIAALLSDQSVCLWDSGNGELLHQDRRPLRVLPVLLPEDVLEESFDPFTFMVNRCDLQFSATGARLACSSGDHKYVRLRNGIDGSFIANLNFRSSLHRVAFSADGSRITTLTSISLNLWSCEDGKLIGIGRSGGSTSLAISTNGSLLATGQGDKATLWSGDSGSLLLQIEVLSLGFSMAAIAFSLDDTLAISTVNCIKLYNVKSHTFISTLSSSSMVLAFSPDCTRLAGGGFLAVHLWDIRGFETSSPFPNEQEKRHISALALSRDCSRVACGFVSGEVELRETGSLGKQLIATGTHHAVAVATLVYSPDGRQFASGSNDGTVNLWDGKDGALRGTLQYPTKPGWWGFILVVGVSNTVLAVAGGNGIVLWDLKTLHYFHTFAGSFGACLSFSADGALLAAVRNAASNDTASDDITPYRRSPSPFYQTIIFDVTTRTIISTIDIDSHAMAFLPDNSQLVVQHLNDDEPHVDVGDPLTFNLINGKLERGPTFAHFMQLRNIPLWHGVPVLTMHLKDPPYLGALFSGHDRPVPVLWIPREFRERMATAQGRSAIAFVDDVNSSIIYLRILTSPLGW